MKKSMVLVLFSLFAVSVLNTNLLKVYAEEQCDSTDVLYVEQRTEEIEYPEPYMIRVNKQADCVTVYCQNEDGEFNVPVKAMACSCGKTGNTPVGTYRTHDYRPWGLMKGNVWAQYAIRFKKSFLFHSVPYYQQSKSTLEEGEYNKLGTDASLGCVRLAVEDVKWLYDNCSQGTLVEVYNSEDPGPLGKPLPIVVSGDSEYRGWDPTDPDENNPWIGKLQNFEGIKDIVVLEGTMDVDLMHSVISTDYDGTRLPVELDKRGLDIDLVGEYDIVYSSTGAKGATVSKTAKVYVVENMSAWRAFTEQQKTLVSPAIIE